MYIIDTNAILDLDGQNDSPPVVYSETERGRIWAGIHQLAGTGQIVIVHQGIEELKRHHQGDLSWLSKFPTIATLPGADPALDARYKAVLQRFKTFNLGIRHTLDPADPWILAYAWQHLPSHIVVSDELDRASRKHRKTYDSIPDVCSVLNIRCLTLSQFVAQESLLAAEPMPS